MKSSYLSDEQKKKFNCFELVKNRESELRQNAYLKALETKQKIEIHKGLFKKNLKEINLKSL